MNNDAGKYQNKFKYNLSFYYISTIVYLLVFIVVAIVFGKITDKGFTLGLSSIIYLAGLIAAYSLLSLLYNIYKNKELIITETAIVIKTSFSKKSIEKDKIILIKLIKSKLIKDNYSIFVIGILHKKRKLFIRPNDYENSEVLIKSLMEFKENIDKK
ncbi:MAG: hypothetical protein Q8903_01855 [Bacteroidota bacterium]|nr:hypothetical protein [Bacteroidota bacterium]